ncbi:MAG: type I-U CRISPR-associated protein Csb2, partial [Candidatus Eremiobacterota bacterium]
MLTLELRFVAGRYHATPWGRHVNEGVPEWPPSPFRLLRSLVDAWLRKRPDWPPERVEPIMRALAGEAPVFQLPDARASHTRSYLSQNTRDPSDKQLVFDAFAVAPRPVVVAWPSVSLTARQQEDLAELLSLLSYLGRSESWVEARVVDASTTAWNCRPRVQPEENEEPVLVACARPTPFEPTANGKSRKKARPDTGVPDWVDALCWTTAEVASAGLSHPPSLEMVPYVRRRDCFQGRSGVPGRLALSEVQAVMYRLESRVPPNCTDGLKVAEQVRSMVMGSYRRITQSEIP